MTYFAWFFPLFCFLHPFFSRHTSTTTHHSLETRRDNNIYDGSYWKKLSISMCCYTNICTLICIARHTHMWTFIWYLLVISGYNLLTLLRKHVWCLRWWWMICIIWVMTVVVHSRLLSGFLMLFIIIFIPLFFDMRRAFSDHIVTYTCGEYWCLIPF